MLEIKWGLFFSFTVFLIYYYLFSSVFAEKKNSPLKFAFLRYTGFYLLILLCEVLMRLPFMYDSHQIIIRFGFSCFLLTGVTYFDFAIQLFNKTRGAVFWLFLALGVASVAMAFDSHSLIIHYEGKQVIAMPGKTSAIVMAITLMGPTLSAIILMVHEYGQAPRESVQRSITALLVKGSLAAIICGMMFVYVIPTFFPDFIEIYQFTSLSALFVGSYLFYALKKYHFVHIDFTEIENVSRTIFETVNEGVILFNEKGDIQQYNRQAKNILGEINSFQDVEILINNYSFNENLAAVKTEIDTVDGAIPVILSQSDIVDNNAVIGKILIIHDIHEQVHLEKEQERMKDRIRQSEKLESIGQLAGGIAHDFNNQLTGIIGCTEFLKTEVQDNSEAQEMIEMILKTAQRSADLTSKLLAFARKGKYVTTKVDMHETIKEVEQLLKRTIDKRIILDIELTAPHSTVQGDATQLQNALLNLAINGCDAMANGTGVLSFYTDIVSAEEVYLLTGEELPKMAQYLSISVSDTGTGMTEEIRKRIFEPFFTTKEQGKGTGMGLSAVYGTVINHKGSISVNSILGEGTSFNILLPLVMEQAGQQETTASQENLTGVGEILLVDDEPLILKTGRKILESVGYRVTTVDNGLDVLDLIKENPDRFILIVLDMVMPELGGDEVHKHVRKIAPHLPILVSSGYSEEGVAHDLLNDGYTGFLQKPYVKKQLLSRIKKILSVDIQKEVSSH